ncbi:hypothetical protein ACLOJK_013839 [Asimina triloba]
MHLLLRLWKPTATDSDSDPRRRRRKPRLERRNAMKNIDYEPPSSSLSDTSSPRNVRSLDLQPCTEQISFRVDGDGEIDLICEKLGLSGPEDLAISVAAWEAMKVRSSSDVLPRSRFQQEQQPEPSSSSASAPEARTDVEEDCAADSMARVGVRIENSLNRELPLSCGGGIKGARPPVLTPPPLMSLPVLDGACSTWELVRSFAQEDGCGGRRNFDDEDDESEGDDVEVPEDDAEGRGYSEGDVDAVEISVVALFGSEEGREAACREMGEFSGCSFTTSNDDDSSSTTTESMFIISPNGRFKRNIRTWIRGGRLGSGSFGTVYEGISE